ncbi:hypothetical protein JOD54_003154 [Actinokineospora baliensis]|uniref:hypothetical protein n=1 Tax=Actinokineospora baliensis TaxID=547056 RepID=UPI0019579255|nr:hypothetical protein [Actinokineospora baliensis]MBM7772950.1 hypothetical protein [Actinokineospora baliensis]
MTTLRPWEVERAREFAALRGRRIESWVGEELALREDFQGLGPQFDDPEVPFLQMNGLQANLDHGDALSISDYQADEGWGLFPWPGAHFEYQPKDRIYRRRPLPELPVGDVDEVVVLADGETGLLAELRMVIGGTPLSLVSGEVQERMNGTLSIARLDECVLVFTNPADVDRVPWINPLTNLVPVHR